MSLAESSARQAGTPAFLRWLGRPHAARWVVLLGVVIALPTLAIGFFTDDWYMRAALHHAWPEAPAWWDLFNFVAPTDDGVRAEIASGVLPWWTTPTLRLHLVRPLASALLALDDRVWGSAVIGWHLHSLVWWAALLLVVAALFRRMLPGATGTLALLIFALSPAHSHPYGWPSSRHMLVGGVPALAALLAHMKAREDGWRPGLWLAPLGLAVGLAGSEAVLGVVALWVTYEALGPAKLGDLWSRARGAAPAVILAGAYLVVYKLVGGGTVGSEAYFAPQSEPLRFAVAAAQRLPMLLGDALLGAPVELAIGGIAGVFVGIGVVAVVLAFTVWRGVRDLATPEERAAICWLVPGSVFAVLGTCGGLPGGRALLLADVGFASLLAVLVVRAWERGVSSFRYKAASRLFAGFHLVLAPLGVVGGALVTTLVASRGLAAANALPAEIRPAQRVFILAASDPMIGVYTNVTLAAEGLRDFTCLARLTATHADYRVTATGATSLAIEPVDHPLVRSTFETLYRSLTLSFHVGDTVLSCGARVRVAATQDGSPTRLDVDLGAPLDDPSVAMVAWDGHGLARVHLAPGETKLLPWRPGPMGTQ